MQSMLRRLLPENVALETELLRDAVGIKADRGQIEQIILNLVVNARDATPRGGRIMLGVRQVHFADTSVEEHQGERQGHTGLGLAIVYGIVQQSGGHITVKSEQGAAPNL